MWDIIAHTQNLLTSKFALDLDGPLGKQNFEKLKSELGELPETVTVNTGGGGIHYYFKIPIGMELKNSANQLIEKVDVRGEGGFVVGPGSMHHTGNFYEYEPGLDISSVEIAELPLPWAERIASPLQRNVPESDAASPVISDYERSNPPFAGLTWRQTLETSL